MTVGTYAPAPDGSPPMKDFGDDDAPPFLDGGSFILDIPDYTPAVWGDDDDVLWAQGEALMIVGGNGVGKTTLAAQVVRARLGLQGTVLGLRVAVTTSRVLYLAMDRPQQVARALHRTFRPEDRDILSDHLLVWKGPPPMDMAKQPDILLRLCRQAGADTVVVDSLKDAAVGLSDDETGAGWNRARQLALANSVEVLELHHNVKRGANGGPPTSIADVYGSMWITAGAGSVMFLHGDPGDPIVQMRHLKQPAETVGPWQIEHDHTRGVSGIHQAFDVLRFAGVLEGVTAKDVARHMNREDKPSAALVERARRKLASLEKAGHLTRLPGDSRGSEPDRWRTTLTTGELRAS